MTPRGYALLETLIATVLLVSGIVHLATIFSFTEGITFRNRQRTVATLLVYEKMEILQSTPAVFGGGLDPLHPSPAFVDNVSIGADGTPYLRLWQIQSSEPHLVTVVVFARVGMASPLEQARATGLLRHR